MTSTRERATKLVNALQSKELRQLLPLFRHNSLIVYNSELPTGGVYRGFRGLALLASRWKRLVRGQNASYNIKYVDEARDTCVLEGSYSGEFIRTGRKFENLKTLSFIQWANGRVSKMNCVDEDFNKTFALFRTRAEELSDKLTKQVMECGDCEETQEMIAEDAIIAMPNLYPVELRAVLTALKPANRTDSSDKNSTSSQPKSNSTSTLAAQTGSPPINSTSHQGNATKPSSSMQNATAGQDEKNMTRVGVIGRGKQGFGIIARMVNRLVNHTVVVKTLYGDNDTVIKACVLSPFPIKNREPIHPNLMVAAHELTVLWGIQRFNQDDKLDSLDIYINRPLPNMFLHYLRNDLAAARSQQKD
jgi:hypothetical protein